MVGLKTLERAVRRSSRVCQYQSGGGGGHKISPQASEMVPTTPTATPTATPMSHSGFEGKSFQCLSNAPAAASLWRALFR